MAYAATATTPALPGASSARQGSAPAAAAALPPSALPPSSATCVQNATKRWAGKAWCLAGKATRASRVRPSACCPSRASHTCSVGCRLQPRAETALITFSGGDTHARPAQCNCGAGQTWDSAAAECQCAHGLMSVNDGRCNACASGFGTASFIKVRDGAPVCDTCVIGYKGTSCSGAKCRPCADGSSTAKCPAACQHCFSRGMKGYVGCRACKAGDSNCNCLSMKLWNGSKCCGCSALAPAAACPSAAARACSSCCCSWQRAVIV
jgi:hypothetical protein